MARRRRRPRQKADFRTDPTLLTVYQIAEDLGKWPDEVRDTLSPAQLCEWGVYLNSPFSRRGREALMNGWTVHVIRSIMADKRRPPKFGDSMFPFAKIAREFFAETKAPAKAAPGVKGKVTTKGEAAHLTQVARKVYEQQLAAYRAGKIPNRAGLYIGEKIRK